MKYLLVLISLLLTIFACADKCREPTENDDVPLYAPYCKGQQFYIWKCNHWELDYQAYEFFGCPQKREVIK